MVDEIAPSNLDTLSRSEPETDDAPSEEAPFGWMNDPETGERRPRKRPGRRPRTAAPPVGKTPTILELQALGSLPEASEDTAPGTPPKGKVKLSKEPAPVPAFRAGVIAKAMNRLYRRAGRICRLFDHDIGTAIIASARTRPKDDDDEDDEDLTVGEAWENLAKTNPRIRAFLWRFMQGGAWTGLFMAHLPILMAIVMKDGIRERLPLLQLVETFMADGQEDEDGDGPPSGFAGMMGDLNPQDMAQMMAMAQGMMGQMANGVGRPPNAPYRGPSVSHPPYQPNTDHAYPPDPE